MNEETALRHDAVLDLGTEFRIYLLRLSNSRENYTIEQFIAAMEATSTLTDLTVNFFTYRPTPENNRRFIEPLCRCITNLRCRNEHHPLRALTLQSADLRYYGGMMDVFEQFLIAATKYGGISQVKLLDVHFLPIQCLVEFCRNNHNIKVVEVNKLYFSAGIAPMSVAPNRTQDSSVMLALDKLTVSSVNAFFDNSAASTFAKFIARMNVRALVLGRVWANAAAADDLQMTKRILSEIKIPSVKQLKLQDFCHIEHFKAALEVGTTSLIELDVHIDHDNDDYTERLELLANFIRIAVQLNSLTIRPYLLWIQPITLRRELLRAIEACATIARIRVLGPNGQRHFSRDEVQQHQQLLAMSARNKELARLVASPSTYPTDKLLGLTRQFDNCPTGRYMLARNLPVVFSFEKIKSTDSSTTELNSKKRKIS